MRKSVLLTGGSGFLGRRLLDLLVKKYRVFVLVRPSTDLALFKNFRALSDFKIVSDVGAKKILTGAGVDFIIHTATCYGREQGETFSDVIRANLLLPVQLLEWGIRGGISAFINTDTFFNIKIGFSEKERAYVKTKKYFLAIAREMIEHSAVKLINLRVEHMYGPGDGGKKFIPQIARKILRGEKIDLTRGTQTRDFVFVDDVAAAFLAASARVAALGKYEEFGIGTGRPASVRKTVEIINKLAGGRATLNWGARPYRHGEIMSSRASLKNNKKINWRAAVSLKEGLKQTVASLSA